MLSPILSNPLNLSSKVLPISVPFSILHRFYRPTTTTYHPGSDVWTSEIPLELLHIVQEDILIHPNPPSHPADCDIPVAPFVPRFFEESILNKKREGEEPRFEHLYRYDPRGTALAFTPSLNVPSHVVLNHLNTSTMQGEVVGLASTARYKAKVSDLVQEFYGFK